MFWDGMGGFAVGRFNLFTMVGAVCLAGFVFAGDAADVTAKVADSVKDGKLSIAAGNELFGDPAQGEVKRLKVEYSVGDETKTIIVAENGQVDLTAPAGKKLIVKRAIYGVFDDGAWQTKGDPAAAGKGDPSPAGLLEALPGFKVEHVLKADPKVN